jgi:hypothetical protein
MSGEFGIDVPDGDPGALEAAAADLRGAAGVLGRVSTTLQASGSVTGWSGIASMTFENACVNDASVAAAADGSLQVGALILSELAEALRIATRQAEAAVDDAREADRRRRDAEDDETLALRRAALADLDADAAAYEITLRQSAGEPAFDAQDRQYAAQREAAAARDAAAAARERAARAQRDFEEAQRRGRRAVRRYREYADGAAGRLAGIAAMAPTVTALPPPPAPAGDGSDEGGGNALTGLGKGFEDLWNEGKGLVTGTFNHVNVFNQDKWQDTWSNDWDIANAIYDDPLGSGEAVLSGMWAPIKESYEHGGVDEATARAIPSIAGTILGGKGLTKLNKLDDAAPEAPSPSDTPKVMAGGEGPDGSFIPEVLEGDQLPLTARPEPGQEVTRVYGQPADRQGPVPVDHDGYAQPGGRSYTPERIEDMADPRDHLGLPNVNGGRFVIHGELVDVKDVLVRHALPLDGTRGGAIEYLIPDPGGQVRIVEVESVNPPH